MQTMQKTEDQQQYGISRLVAFSDRVFGFAITLLIINVISAFPPLPSSASDERLVGALLGLGSSFFSYALSFYVVRAYWVGFSESFAGKNFLVRHFLIRSLLLKEYETVSHFLHGLAPAHTNAEKKPPTEHKQ